MDASKCNDFASFACSASSSSLASKVSVMVTSDSLRLSSFSS